MTDSGERRRVCEGGREGGRYHTLGKAYDTPEKAEKRVFLLLPLLAGDSSLTEAKIERAASDQCQPRLRWNIVTSQNQEKKTDDVYVLSLGKR